MAAAGGRSWRARRARRGKPQERTALEGPPSPLQKAALRAALHNDIDYIMHPADVQTMLSTLNYVDDTEPEEDPERMVKGRTSRTSAKAAEEAADGTF